MNHNCEGDGEDIKTMILSFKDDKWRLLEDTLEAGCGGCAIGRKEKLPRKPKSEWTEYECCRTCAKRLGLMW